jgi:hypothetical protein
MQAIYELHPELLDKLSISHFNFNVARHSYKFLSKAIPKYRRSASIYKVNSHINPIVIKIQGECYSHFADITSAKVKYSDIETK